MTSATPGTASPPGPSPSLFLSFGHSLIVYCLSYVAAPKTAQGIQGEAAPVQSNPGLWVMFACPCDTHAGNAMLGQAS